MPNYKKMYFKLFRACSDTLEMLQQATLETEEMAMSEEGRLTASLGDDDVAECRGTFTERG